jgi:adenine phosphoribosyltransferase
MKIETLFETYPDFPKPGILYWDINALLSVPGALAEVVSQISSQFDWDSIDLIAGIESRGFMFAGNLAERHEKGMTMIRKAGKLPGELLQVSYGLEYGEDVLELQQKAIPDGARVLIVDDLLATGGTAKAAASLVEKAGGKVAGFSFIIELSDLNGRNGLSDYNVNALFNPETIPG